MRESIPFSSVSVCIPAHNEARNLGRLLEFLQGERTLAPLLVEVLVDVSGSTDSTAEIARGIASRWNRLRVIDHGARDGLLQAMNRLIRNATGEIILRMDADVQPDPGALSLLLRPFALPTVGIAGPRILPLSGRSQWANRLSETEWRLHHSVSRLVPKTTIVQAFRRLSITLPADSGIEDAALQEQVERAGYRPAYAPEARVRIMPASTLGGFLRQRIRTIEHIRRHLRRGYSPPSTATPGVILRAMQQSLRMGEFSLVSLGTLVASETMARAIAYLRSLTTRATAFDWEPVDGTKEFDWGALPRVQRGEGAPVPSRADNGS